MATNPRIPSGDRKQPELVPNNDVIKPRRPGRPIGVLIGIVAAAALLAAVVYFFPRNPKNMPPTTNAQVPLQPVPGELQLEGMQLKLDPTTESFYLDGRVMNTGPHSITGALAEVKLRDGQNKVVLDVRRPLEGMVLKGNDLLPDAWTKDPIKPNDTRPFRLTVDNVPASWNHNLPEVQIVDVAAVGK